MSCTSGCMVWKRHARQIFCCSPSQGRNTLPRFILQKTSWILSIFCCRDTWNLLEISVEVCWCANYGFKHNVTVFVKTKSTDSIAITNCGAWYGAELFVSLLILIFASWQKRFRFRSRRQSKSGHFSAQKENIKNFLLNLQLWRKTGMVFSVNVPLPLKHDVIESIWIEVPCLESGQTFDWLQVFKA